MTDEKNQERAKNGKFKKAEDPQQPPSEGENLPKNERPLIKTRVTGQSTKLAAIQTGRLKWKDGEPQPELVEGEENDDK